MATAPLMDRGSGSRLPPDLMTVFREELIMVHQRWSQGRPWIMGGSWVLLVYILAGPRAGSAIFVLLGTGLGIAPLSNRFVGRSVEWELPVDRTVFNRLRVASGLAGITAVVVLLTPLVVYFNEMAWYREPLTVLATGIGGGVVGFTAGFILGQATRRLPSATFIVGFSLLFLIAFLPSRFILWILPEVAHVAVIGRYGLKTFTGWGVGGVTSEAMLGVWSLQNWLTAALVWGTICFGLLFVVSATHQE